MNETADVVVIGAGVMGASTAFRLAERGLKVTVVEKNFVGSGSTAKSSAIIRQHYSNEITARMALFSLRVFQHFDEVVGGECGFRPTGFLVLASAEQAAGMEANIALQRAVGIQTGLLSPEELRELAPGLAGAEEVVAAYEPESGYADPVLTTTAFMAAARRLGATVHQQTEVTGLRFSGGRVTGVITNRGEIAAGAVVNTAGPWGARVARMAGIELPVQPCRVQVALFAPPPGHGPVPLVVADFVHAIYHRPETGEMTLVGSVDPAEANDHADPDAYNEYVDTAFVLDSGERLARRFPYMEAGHSRQGYAGIYDVTPDWHPVIDEPIPGSGFFVAVGHSGHGFKLAPAVGVMVADLVTGQKTEGLDSTLFRLARYAQNEPVRGRYAYSIAG
ncbi:MAG: FAD-dependent oxidoreductase [Anaerolineae bacterium]|nr:FAD-binding oxidoreductase [Caldilineales bacterium]MDW8270084.1 FAD-dependent oxidoreductase [Anaerolineae bacterium]